LLGLSFSRRGKERECGFRFEICVDGGCSILFVASLRRRVYQDILLKMQVGGSKFELPSWPGVAAGAVAAINATT
jgi:hypothetical protein